ncbi:MAG TPA: tail fiber domain-containing protein [Bryobacteraceae bacterium]|nr:tail fiber domain-containing protein [Bryobacteraceae bacterium]
MMRLRHCVMCCASFLFVPGVRAQVSVPHLVNFNGAVRDTAGKPLAGPQALTFSIYADTTSRTPLWQETQSVQTDEQGRYTVHLGAATANGIPLELFTSSQPLWLGVQPQSTGAVEQPRVLLVSAPYALKAADADTLGGKPASAFVTREAVSATGGESLAAAGTHSRETIGVTSTVGGAGTAGYIPMWTDSADIGDSVLFQSGTKIGLGTTVPSYDFDLYKSQNQDTVFEVRNPNVGSASRANLRLLSDSALFSLIAGSVANGGGLYFQGQGDTMMAFQQIANAPISFYTDNLERMRVLANGNVGIGTTAPAAKLEVNGTAKFDGLITFAAGQTFPGGGGGTITAVNAGAGLAGGGTSGSVSLGLQNCASGQELQSTGAGWACVVPANGTITAVNAGTDLTGGGTGGSVTLNVDVTKVAQLNSANIFTVNQTIAVGSAAADGLDVSGGNSTFGGVGVWATGGSGNGSYGGAGVHAIGGSSNAQYAGDGIDAYGGNSSQVGGGGYGIYAVAGYDQNSNPSYGAWITGKTLTHSAGDLNNPQFELDQDNSSDYDRLRFKVGSAASYWDIAMGPGAQPVLNIYRSDVGNVMSLVPGDTTNLMVMSNGARLTKGGVWTNNSDRNLKTDFRAVSGAEVLRRLDAMPITNWSYKTEGEGVRHIGPMAQDFAAAFRVGSDDTHITTIDESGVALAAIQQLYRENQELKAAVAALQRRLDSRGRARRTRNSRR